MLVSTVLIFCLAILILFFSYKKSVAGSSFSETPFLWPLGIFVWGDGLILAPFWICMAVVMFFSRDWHLLYMLVSLFWLVRSAGEVIYWFNQQFSTLERNNPKHMLGYQLVKNDSVWYLYQLFWQCIVIASAAATLYTAAIWIQTI